MTIEETVSKDSYTLTHYWLLLGLRGTPVGSESEVN